MHRLQSILKLIVSENQSAFIIGKMIQDNLVLTQKAFRFLKSNTSYHFNFFSLYVQNLWSSGMVFLISIIGRNGFPFTWLVWLCSMFAQFHIVFLLMGCLKVTLFLLEDWGMVIIFFYTCLSSWNMLFHPWYIRPLVGVSFMEFSYFDPYFLHFFFCWW